MMGLLSSLIFSSGAIIADSSGTSATSLYGAWPANNNTPTNLNIATDTLLNPGNVASLTPAWSTFGFNPTGANAVQSTPVIADGVVYVAEAGGTVKAYNENGSGSPLWSSPQLTCPGLANADGSYNEFFDESPVLTKKYVFIAGECMHKLDRSTGKEVVNPAIYDPSLGKLFSPSDIEPSQIMLAGDKVIYGIGYGDETNATANYNMAQGKIIAFYQSDLSIAWSINLSTYGAPAGSSFGPGSGTFAGGGVDSKRHLFFIGVGNQYSAPASPYSDSLLAINYNTGKLVWSYQYAANDLWGGGGDNQVYDGMHDLDVPAHPQIFSLNMIPGVATSAIDLVGARGKDGTYRIFKRDQSDPNNVLPVAQIQLDPATANAGAIQLEPALVTDSNDNVTLYISSTSYVPDPVNAPSNHSSLDYIVASGGRFAPIFLATTTVRAIDVRQLVQYGQSQIANGNTVATCVGNLTPSRCTGQLPSSIIKWQITQFPFSPSNSSGMTYDNDILFMPGIQGKVALIQASTGNVLGNLIPGPTTAIPGLQAIPVFGGVSVDNGMVFAPIGVSFGGGGLPFGGMTAYKLP